MYAMGFFSSHGCIELLDVAFLKVVLLVIENCVFICAIKCDLIDAQLRSIRRRYSAFSQSNSWLLQVLYLEDELTWRGHLSWSFHHPGVQRRNSSLNFQNTIETLISLQIWASSCLPSLPTCTMDVLLFFNGESLGCSTLFHHQPIMIQPAQKARICWGWMMQRTSESA